MSKITRKTAEDHLKKGWPVIHEGVQVNRPEDLPPEDAKGEYHATRLPDGNLSRAGMEQVLKEGGTVMHHGKAIDKIDDLPGEADLAAGDAAQEDLLLAGYDEQIKAIEAKKATIIAGRGARAKAAKAADEAAKTADAKTKADKAAADKAKADAEKGK